MKWPLCLLALLLLPAAAIYADDRVWEEEVAHLLNYIEHSACTFIRNGTSYTSADARSHIERKYNHIKNRIASAEQFITYGASKSSITGNRYLVECNGVTVPSGPWLRDELAAFRKARHP